MIEIINIPLFTKKGKIVTINKNLKALSIMITLPRNIPLYVHPSFWILASLIGWLGSQSLIQFGLWVVVVFMSVLVHELGHALTARIWYQRVHIELGPMGGLTVRKDQSRGKFREFLIVLMGPLCGILLSFFAFFLLGTSPLNPNLSFFLYITYVANLFWSLFNLLPVHPLDGGKLM